MTFLTDRRGTCGESRQAGLRVAGNSRKIVEFALERPGRLATAEEGAGPISFPSPDPATFLTGEILNINGGAFLCG